VTIAPEPKNDAWWLRTTYRPSGKSIRGIPIREIDPNWCAATVFTKEAFPAGLLDARDSSLADTGAAFAIAVKPTNSAPLTALVGSFMTCDAATGTFLLIIDEGEARTKFVEEWQTEQRSALFAVLHKLSEERLEVWFCFACDNFSVLEWNAATARFGWKPQDEDQEDE
jgi:hypothetical protein